MKSTFRPIQHMIRSKNELTCGLTELSFIEPLSISIFLWTHSEIIGQNFFSELRRRRVSFVFR